MAEHEGEHRAADGHEGAHGQEAARNLGRPPEEGPPTLPPCCLSCLPCFFSCLHF
jgi:hypothetical protein